MKICVCCKQEVDDCIAIMTDRGAVHPGYCYEVVQAATLNESAEEEQEQLNETTLLM